MGSAKNIRIIISVADFNKLKKERKLYNKYLGKNGIKRFLSWENYFKLISAEVCVGIKQINQVQRVPIRIIETS